MLKQAASIYTAAMFIEFRNEYDESSALVAKQKAMSKECVVYSVSKYKGECYWLVTYNSSTYDLFYNFNKFQSIGILCFHSFKVLHTMDVKEISNIYILIRWTRSARNGMLIDGKGVESHKEPELKTLEQYRLLCPNVVKVATKAASYSKATTLLINGIVELNKKIEHILLSCTSIDEGVTTTSNNATENGNNVEIGFTLCIKEKGIKKCIINKRKKKMQS